jgi:hypothetical protein
MGLGPQTDYHSSRRAVSVAFVAHFCGLTLLLVASDCTQPLMQKRTRACVSTVHVRMQNFLLRVLQLCTLFQVVIPLCPDTPGLNI